jgi:hypothetical protein
VALAREFHEHLADPREHLLRSSSNYFDKAAAGRVAPEALVASLNFSSADFREACYVNWQLLSGVPAPADASTAPVLLSAYRSAPAPISRPGVSNESQRALEGLFKGKKMADEADVAEQWQGILDAAGKDNAPVLAYRDELYHRLPKGFETFAAAMEDLLVRLNAVIESKERVKALAGDMKAWASSESPPAEQLSALARAARRLADSKGPQYYVSASWRESSSAFVWRKSRTGIDTAHELKDLASFLDEQARQPVLKLDVKERANKN